jgi:hypothetical protein
MKNINVDIKNAEFYADFKFVVAGFLKSKKPRIIAKKRKLSKFA